MKARWAIVLSALIASCTGGSTGASGGSFRLIQFMESNQNEIPRNRVLTFLFSAPVADGQDFFERLKIENTQPGNNSNFSLAIGTYEVVGDRVTFAPRLPNKEDRSDGGFREDGEYTVFLKAGPDALRSASGEGITVPQEMIFDTNKYFEDPFPAEPPRATGLFAVDATQGPGALGVNIGRMDPRPGEVALLDNAALIGGGRFIEPGAGGAPQFSTPWRLELRLSEPVDPATVTASNIQLFEIYSNATTTGDTAPPGAPPTYFGTPVNFLVPINVTVEQKVLENGDYDVRIVVQPLATLVDNTRYRLVFAGTILGIDYRQEFIGQNGVTGDGVTSVGGPTPYPEPGGLGYTTEFIVRDRPSITSKRTVTYDPIVDGIDAELGQTTTDPAKFNTALYNPAQSPSTALGYLGAFGTGIDGDLAVNSGTVTIDTSDTANANLGKPFNVLDLNPNDDYLNNTLPGANRTYDSRQPFTLNLKSLTVSAGSTLRFVGVNPVVLRVQGVTQIAGTLDVSGANGQDGSANNVVGGKAGPGGGNGGNSSRGVSCSYLGVYANCGSSPFSGMLSSCGFASWPYSLNGTGPGRGHAGGSSGGYSYYAPTTYGATRSTGGGGGSHGTIGQDGSDITSANAAPGTGGGCYATTYYALQNSSVVGVRGKAGAVNGDPTVLNITWGGSGGGAGGSSQDYAGFGTNGSGGAGGGAGGSVTIIGAGSIIATGGLLNARGGNGGAGISLGWSSSPQSYNMSTGGGGAGSGGTLALISGENIALTASVLDTNGGTGGAAPQLPTGAGSCTNCNGGGNGGKGILFLMDPDGLISGLSPNGQGTYPTFTGGYLTISTFATGAAGRFGETRAITELFASRVANPAYLQLNNTTDVLAHVGNGSQQIFIYASTAKADTKNPLNPNVASEIAPVLVARAYFALGATQVETYNNMSLLNPTGPNRDAFIRINALFNYGNIVEAALGPFAYMDRMDVSFSFN